MPINFCPRIATVGVHILDTLGTPVDSLPDGQDSHRLKEIRITPGGTAAGVAVDLAILGANVATFGVVGNDSIGDFLVRSLGESGVDTTGLIYLAGGQTASSILLVRNNGDRPALHVRGVNAIATWEDLNPVLDKFDAVHFGGLDAMSGLDRKQSLSHMYAARERGAFVSLDFQSAPRWLDQSLLEFLPAVDVFMPNLEQAQGLVGPGSAEQVVARLLAKGARAVVITCGEDGALYGDGKKSLRHPAFAIEVIDTTGCGDAFCAAFVLSTVRGNTVEVSLRLASAAAALAAASLGSDGHLQKWSQLEKFASSTALLA